MTTKLRSSRVTKTNSNAISVIGISVMLMIVFFTVGAQQVQALFGSTIAVLGRWVSVGLLLGFFYLAFISKGLNLSISRRWALFFYLWFFWEIFLIIYHQLPLGEVLENRVARYLLLLAGIGLVSQQSTPEKAVRLLNRSYFILSVLLVAASVTFLPSFELLSPQRFLGLFRLPNYLSWTAANVFLAIVGLIYYESRRHWSLFVSMTLVVGLLGTGFVLIATKTRGSIVAVVISMVVFLWNQGSRSFAKWLIVGSIILGYMLWAFDEQIYYVLRVEYNSTLGTVDINQITSGRYDILELSVAELRQYPQRLLVGTGTRAELRLASLTREGGWHDPLALVHSSGVLGLVLYNTFVLSMVIITYLRLGEQRRLSVVDVWLYPMTLLWLVRMFVSSLVDSNLIIGHMDYVYFWLVAGCLIVAPKQTVTSEKEDIAPAMSKANSA